MIIYLHGFNSAADVHNEKAIALRNEFGDRFVQITYDSFATREEIISKILSVSAEYDNDVVFMGTSLGGYFALECGRLLGRPSIGINVACKPHDFLMKIGCDYALSNYVNGQISCLTAKTINSYLGNDVKGSSSEYSKIPMILLDRDDEVFDSVKTAAHFSDCRPHLFDGGNHRFSHILDALDLIKSYVKS